MGGCHTAGERAPHNGELPHCHMGGAATQPGGGGGYHIIRSLSSTPTVSQLSTIGPEGWKQYLDVLC